MILNPLNLLTLKVKAILATALLLAGVWYVRHRETVAYEHGLASGHQSGWADAEKQRREQWDAQWERLKQDAEYLNGVAKQQQAQREELARSRAALTRELSAQLAAITTHNLEQKQNAQTLPSSDLVPTILHTLDDLDLLERERASRSERPTAN